MLTFQRTVIEYPAPAPADALGPALRTSADTASAAENGRGATENGGTSAVGSVVRHDTPRGPSERTSSLTYVKEMVTSCAGWRLPSETLKTSGPAADAELSMKALWPVETASSYLVCQQCSHQTSEVRRRTQGNAPPRSGDAQREADGGRADGGTLDGGTADEPAPRRKT